MSGIEGFCKHGNIWRNCYSCHIDFTYPKEITPMDTIHETLSELKIRVSKLEEYKRLQDDINKERAHLISYKSYLDLADEIKKLSDFQSIINQRWSTCVEHKNRQIDENRSVYKHLIDLEESYQGLSAELRHLLDSTSKSKEAFSQEPIILNLKDSNGEEVQFVGKVNMPKETLCMDKFTNPAPMTFVQAFKAFNEGKAIFRKNSMRFVLMDRSAITFSPDDILATDWEASHEI